MPAILRPGDRIPASRELATVLGVHRTTVANAYAELESEGLIQGHVGRGTFIQGNGNGLEADSRRLRRCSAMEMAMAFAGNCCLPMNAATKSSAA